MAAKVQPQVGMVVAGRYKHTIDRRFGVHDWGVIVKIEDGPYEGPVVYHVAPYCLTIETALSGNFPAYALSRDEFVISAAARAKWEGQGHGSKA